jgi:hypothetical protein
MSAERHQNKIELSPALVQSYATTFIQRYDRYPLQKDDGTYVSLSSPLHLPLIEGHLKGHVTIGAYALNEHSETTWLCFDADTPDDWQALIQLSDSLAYHHTPSYLEQSRPERGGHLWLFLPSPLSGTDARRLGKQLLTSLKTTTLELYPKQHQLRTGSGSLVRLPLGIHKLTHHRYHFIYPDGTPLAPTIREQIALLAHPDRLSSELVNHILSLAPPAEPRFPTQPFKKHPRNRIVGATPSERIKNRISVHDFVSQFVELNASGKGLCPFHDDHIYSFGVNTDGNYWHCFAGCGGGSVIDFWMRWRKLKGQDDSFKKSVTELAKMLL